MQAFSIDSATSSDDLAAIRDLFGAYTQSLGIDLAYQGYEQELSSLPGKYAKPGGALMLARDEQGLAVGCVALRSLVDNEVAEMKRLYVAPEGRGRGLGKALAESAIQEARAAGYRAVRLDTLSTMHAALALYASLGFQRVEAYYHTPIACTVFLEKRL